MDPGEHISLSPQTPCRVCDSHDCKCGPRDSPITEVPLLRRQQIMSVSEAKRAPASPEAEGKRDRERLVR